MDELHVICPVGVFLAGPQVRTRTTSYQKDVDMRAQPPGTTDGSYNQILMQAYEQHQRGDLNVDAYKRVISEVSIFADIFCIDIFHLW